MHRRHPGAGEHGGGREIHLVRDRHQVALGDDKVLGVPAVHVEAKLPRFPVTDVVAAGQALFAPPAEDLVVDGDAIARGQAGALAGRLHHPCCLVPEGHGVGIRLDHAVQDVQVRAAHSGGVNPYQDLADTRRRGLEIIQAQAQVLEDSGSSHWRPGSFPGGVPLLAGPP